MRQRNLITVTAFMLCALVFVIPTQAQTGLEIGLKGGMNFASISGDSTTGLSSLSGAVFGGSVAFPIGTSLAFQPELLYSGKGTAIEEFGISFDLKLTYLEIPVLIKYNIPTTSTVTPSLYAGPSIGLLLSADLLGVDVKDLLGFNSTDIGLTFGGGLGVATGSGKLTFDARYTLGLTDIDDDDLTWKNNALTAMVGYSMKLGN